LIAHAYGDDPRSCAFIQWEPRHEGRFDEASDAFRALTDGKRGDLLTLDPFFCRVRDGSPELGASLLPRDLSKIFSISPPPPILSAHGSREDSTFPTLQQICQVLGLEGIIATPNLRTEAPDGTRTYDQWRFEVHWPNGLKHHHSGLSFGQKRLLAFLWYLGCIPEGPVITDELVNGFHHSWIETCLNIISERQAFMASQNPLLLDFLDFENAEEVRGSFVFCEKTVDEGEPVQWRWRNMDQAEAAAVYRAYKVGIQHVSNILQSKGLW